MSAAAIIFTISALLLLYVLAVYPLLLAIAVHYFGRPVRKEDSPQTVSVIIAVRNGDRWLRRKIESVLALDYPREMMEILIVSDGSTDGTEEIARSFAAEGVRLIVVPPGGKPAALNAAVPHANGDLLFLTDVRQVLDRECLRHLVACMADPDVGVVSGNLKIKAGTTVEEESTGLYWRYENFIRHNMAQLDSMLGATGPVYLVRRRLYVPIPPDCLLDDMYLPMSIHLAGYRLALEEEAIAIDEPTLLSSEFRRKVRTQAGNLQLLALLPGLFTSRNRMRFHYLSLKVGRLLLPWLLLAALVSSVALPGLWKLLAVPQLLFWLTALMDGLFPHGSAAKRVTGPARAFAVLIFSAVAALKILVLPARSLWVEARAR